MKPLSLYIHIPYCTSKCAYCDFVSFPGALDSVPRYLGALFLEMKEAAARYPGRRVETVFFGGGTPSLLSGAQAAQMLGGIRAVFDVLTEAEITLEANPGTLTREKLEAYRDAGINRLSLGAQARQDALLSRLGRIHRWPQVEQAVQTARQAGFANVSMDLMFGLPGQTRGQWRETLDAALALGVDHLSCYGLILEPGTPLAVDVASGGMALPPEDEERAMYHETRGRLSAVGWEQYELSNFARPGLACRHNLVYWRRDEYLGLGVAAHSLMEEERFGNTERLETYLNVVESGGSPAVSTERIDAHGQAEEYVMLGLRLTEGIEKTAFAARTGKSLEAFCSPALDVLIRQGFLEETGTHIRLTARGMDVHSAILTQLL